MRKLLLLLITISATAIAMAQSVPQGMKYQAVARDLSGNLIANQKVVLKITLFGSTNGKRAVFYAEEHETTTSDLGLFNLVLGEGKNATTTFASVPWSTQDIWMEVSIRDRNSAGFATISNSRLLAVPYAFHAATAAELSGSNIAKTSSTNTGIPAQVWSLKGNSKTNPLTDRFGTTDAADLVFITNNFERLRITADGDISLKNKLEVGTDLTVKGNVALNTVSGSTTINGPLTVNKTSPSKLTGTLTVDGEATFNNNLTVTNGSTTALTGALTVDKDAALKSKLTVDGATNLNSSLNVNNGAATVLTGNLTVNKNTDLDGTLNVDGKSRFRDSVTFDKAVEISGSVKSSALNVSGTDNAHVATIENKNNSTGDGLLIKLGKTNPMWNGSAYVNVAIPFTQGIETQVNQIRSWIYGTDDFNTTDLINLVPSQWAIGTAANITNYVTSQINSAIGLPKKIGPYSIPETQLLPETKIFNGISFGELGSVPALVVPAVKFPAVTVIPEVVTMPAIPQIPVNNLPSLSFPVLSFTNVSNSLTKQNEFITFADKDGRTLGAIRAQSIEDFSNDYFDGLKMLQLAEQMIGLDLLKDLLGVIAGVSEMATDFNNIGVEYSSGHGDYAEWLERENPEEAISAGDIVGVRGGKISKNLAGAEQIMAVSHKPIVLGNMPEKEKVPMGNNIAFMGQIPVKIIGPVKAGDYIVAKGDVAGYGVAVDPRLMQVEDFKLAVGRSWTTNSNNGPKLVNTVVGVHNNDFLNIIGGLQKRADNADLRLQAIEQKLNMAPATNKTAPKTF